MKIILLEDDQAQADMLCDWLEAEGHHCEHALTGADFVARLKQADFDLLVLDWELPDMTGIDVLKLVRSTVNWHVPILFVTQRDAESDIVEALSCGADDYMVKRASKAEFLARVTALSRRLGSAELEVSFGPFTFNLENKTVMRCGEEIRLTAREFEVAHYLFQRMGRLVSREQLLRDVWRVTGVNTRTVDVHVSRVRKRLGITPEGGFRIKTVYQHGYRLEQIESTEAA
ncbi:MAG: response regulator transcription factor [Pseudomonadota bacterium]